MGTNRATRLAAVWAAIVAAAVAAPAWAAVISIDGAKASDDGDYTPGDRLGLSPGTKAADPLVKHVINIKDCEAIKAAKSPKLKITFSWIDKSILSMTVPTFAIKIAAPGTSCDQNSTAQTSTDTTGNCQVIIADRTFDNPTTASGQSFDFNLMALLGSTSCQQNQNADAKIYFVVNGASGTTGTATAQGVALNFQFGLQRPLTPTISSITAGNENLKVAWTHTDTQSDMGARVYWDTVNFPQSDPGSAKYNSGLSTRLTSDNYQITDLDNGKPYFVAVVGVDANFNESNATAVQQATPVQTVDFWQKYKQDGGAEQGGFAPCSAGRTGHAGVLGLLAVVGVLGWALRWRRSTLWALALLAPLGLGMARPADAASPQNSSLDLRFGLYQPQIDREFEGTNKATPYASVLADSEWEWGFAYDMRVWHGFGELSVGFSASKWKQTGRSLTVAGDKSDDETALHVVPLTLDAIYRFDVLAERYDFPLVPYAKLGYAYGVWWATNGLGNLARATVNGTTSVARGGTGGFDATFGLRFLLDVLEPAAARSFDIEMGVNHSYLFGEYRQLVLTDWGSSTSIDLSDGVWNFGLAFDL
jgi:hypothetical protein